MIEEHCDGAAPLVIIDGQTYVMRVHAEIRQKCGRFMSHLQRHSMPLKVTRIDRLPMTSY